MTATVVEAMITSTCSTLRTSKRSYGFMQSSQDRENISTNYSSNEPNDLLEFDEEEADDDVPQDDEADGAGQDPDANDDNVVVSGDASAAAAAKEKSNNTVESEKSKRVDNDKRTTTPYMTKYERARVLGTRALQIRYTPGTI